MSRIGLVADSSCGLPRGIAEQYGIEIVPIDLIIDDIPRSNYTTNELIDGLTTNRRVTTSRPSPERFVQAYQSLMGQGCTSIAVATLSSKLSGTYESALLSRELVDLDIQVVDTRTVGLGFGFAVLDAARVIQSQTQSLELVADLIRRQSEQAKVYFYLNSLEFLRRGGRIGAASAVIGTALSVKPILQIAQGAVMPFAKVRTESKALDRLVDAALSSQTNSRNPRFGVEHLGASDRADYCAEKLRLARPDAEIILSEVSAVIGAHAGPGLVAVSASDNPQEITQI